MPEPFVQTYEVTVPRYKNTRGKKRKVGEEEVLVRVRIDLDGILNHHGVRCVNNKCQTSRAGHVLVEFVKRIESERPHPVIG